MHEDGDSQSWIHSEIAQMSAAKKYDSNRILEYQQNTKMLKDVTSQLEVNQTQNADSCDAFSEHPLCT